MKKLLALAVGLTLCVMPSFADDTNKPPPRPEPKEGKPCDDGTATVKPGNTASNADGVEVKTNGPSQGNAKLTPKGGGANCKTIAHAEAGWSGHIKGLDANDFAIVDGGGIGSISGTAGLVTVTSGSYLVTNVSQPGSGNTMTVSWSGGPTILLPGQSVSIP